MGYIDLEKHPVEQAPFVFRGIPFDDVNPKEDEPPLWSQVCEDHYKKNQAILQPILAGTCKSEGSPCGVYGCENDARYCVLLAR